MSRSTPRSHQVNPAQPLSKHLAWENRGGGQGMRSCLSLQELLHVWFESRDKVSPLPESAAAWHLRQRWRGSAKANVNSWCQNEWQFQTKEGAPAATSDSKKFLLLSKTSLIISCISSTCMNPHVLMCNIFITSYVHTTRLLEWTCTHNSVLATFFFFFPSHFWPVKFRESILTTCDCVHGLFYRVSDALNVIDCELHPTEFTLIYSGRLDMYSSVRSVQFSSKIHCDDRAKDLYIYHCFIWHHVIFLCCVTAHMYLCTECVYWYKMHSYGYLWIYIVLNANPYKWSIKLFMTNRVCLWYLSVWDCQVVMLESIINNMEIVFQLKKRINYLHAFLMTVSVTYRGACSNYFESSMHSEKWYQNTLCWLCCLSFSSHIHRHASHFPVWFPLSVSGESANAHQSPALNPFLIDLSWSCIKSWSHTHSSHTHTQIIQRTLPEA